MSRIDIMRSVIRDWASTLGIGADFCNIIEGFHKDKCLIKFKEYSISTKVLDDGVKDFSNIDEKYLKEDANKFFLQISLYLFANKHHELSLLRNIIDSGDYFYVEMSDNYYGFRHNSKLLKLFTRAEATFNHGIYKIKKENLETFYMFFAENI